MVDVLREGKELKLDISLMTPKALVPLHLGGKDPSFLVVSGALAHPVPHCCTSCKLVAAYGERGCSRDPSWQCCKA